MMKKNRTSFFDRTELRDYWELEFLLRGGASLNDDLYEKQIFLKKKCFFHFEKMFFQKILRFF